MSENRTKQRARENLLVTENICISVQSETLYIVPRELPYSTRQNNAV